MVDIVIVNWNSGNYLQKCINSIFISDNEKFVGSVFIIDNNSTDNSIEKIYSSKKIKIIKNKENRGFSKACNQGFKLSTATYTLLLNPDAQLLNNTLKECISFMKENSKIDILGCSLLDVNEKITFSCSRFPTPIRFLFDATGLSKIAPKIFTPALLMTDWNHNESRKVDQVMGAFMFMRPSIFKKHGYFDERFFVYYEELDFSKRVADAGGITFFNCDIKALHSGGGTTNSVKPFRLFLNLRSRLLYAKKHFNFFGNFVVVLCTYLIEPVTRTIFLFIRGKFKEIKQVFEGYKLLIKG